MITVTLPTLHPGQVEAYRLPGRYKAIRCPRRWGKTDLGKVRVCDGAVKGRTYGWFAPDYKIQSEAYAEILDTLAPVAKRSHKNEGVIETITGGGIDFWSLDNERAGRSRKYHGGGIDAGAFTKTNMLDLWRKSIRPTLFDYGGWAMVMSTPNGINDENFFYQICTNPDHGFVEYKAAPFSNPHVPQRWADETDEQYAARREAEIEEIRSGNAPLVYQQEWLAEFVDWSGAAFFSLDKLLVDGEPIRLPDNWTCDAVFAVIDSATKAGKEHDGTAVMFFAQNNLHGTPLIVIDWNVVQIEGALLETWLPTIFEKLEFYARKYRARSGSLGTWIEDKASGMVLNQQAQRHGWPSRAIDSKLTSVGKEERAISVSGYVWREQVKFAADAYDKVLNFKGTTRNHMLSQVVGFRIGQKDQADDLLDCFCYGLALALGNNEGF